MLFYITVAAAQLNLTDLRDDGWLFDMGTDEEPWYKFYSYISALHSSSIFVPSLTYGTRFQCCKIWSTLVNFANTICIVSFFFLTGDDIVLKPLLAGYSSISYIRR